MIIAHKRNASKNSIVYKNIAGAFLIKGLSLVLSLFTMPAYIRFFNDDAVLGLWFTLLSVLNWILTFDLGIGNGLRNHLAIAIAENNYPEARKFISSAYVSTGGLCVLVSLLFLIASPFLNWNGILNISGESVSSSALTTAVNIVFVGILLQMVLKNISSVLYALQKSSVNNFMSLCTSLITVLTLRILPSGSNDENLVVMAWIHIVAAMLPSVAASCYVFLKGKYRNLRPNLHDLTARHAKMVLSLGGVFFIVQIAYLVIMSTNEFIITRLTGNEYVVEYQIYHRVFMLGSSIIALALTPIWSAITMAIAEKDYNWISSIYKKMKLIAVVGTAIEFFIIPFLQFGVNVWLGEKSIDTDLSSALAFACLGSLMLFNNVFSSVANGFGKLKPQLLCFGIGAVLKVPLSWLFVTLFDSWIGVVWANAVLLAIYCVIEPIAIRKMLNKNSLSLVC